VERLECPPSAGIMALGEDLQHGSLRALQSERSRRGLRLVDVPTVLPRMHTRNAAAAAGT
jgi:hypothetical protein